GVHVPRRDVAEFIDDASQERAVDRDRGIGNYSLDFARRACPSSIWFARRHRRRNDHGVHEGSFIDGSFTIQLLKTLARHAESIQAAIYHRLTASPTGNVRPGVKLLLRGATAC